MPILVPESEVSPVLTLPSPHVPGLARVLSATHIESTEGKDVKIYSTDSFSRAFNEPYACDQHMVCYMGFDIDGNPVSALPRITKWGMFALFNGQQPPVDQDPRAPNHVFTELWNICGAYLGVDLDLAGHGHAGERWDDDTRKRYEDLFLAAGEHCSLFSAPSVHYTTRGGLRQIYALNSAIPAEGEGGIQDCLMGLIATGCSLGLDLDDSCRDFGRLFRLPRVVRDRGAQTQTETWAQPYFSSSFGCVDMDQGSPHTGEVLTWEPEEIPRISRIDRRQIEESCELGRLLVARWCKNGRDPFMHAPKTVSMALSDVNVGEMPTPGEYPVLVASPKVTGFNRRIKQIATQGRPTKVIESLVQVIDNPKNMYANIDDLSKGLHQGIIDFCFKVISYYESSDLEIDAQHLYAIVYMSATRAAQLRHHLGGGKVRTEEELVKEVWDIVTFAMRARASKEVYKSEASEVAENRAEREAFHNSILCKENEASAAEILKTFVRWLPEIPIADLQRSIQQFMIVTPPSGGKCVLKIGKDGRIGYTNQTGDHSKVLALARDCGHSLINIMGPLDPRTGASSFKSEVAMMQDYGTVLDEVRPSRLVDATCIRREDDKLILVQRYPGMARNRFQPVFHEEVDQWLRALGGILVERFLDWLATYTQIKYPTSALILCGASGAGKGMLVAGLAQMTESRIQASFSELLSSFQTIMAKTPLVVADENVEGASAFQDKSLINNFKKLISGEADPVNQKNKDHFVIDGNWRVVATGNNASNLIKFKEDINQKDMDALTSRTLFIAPNNTLCLRLLSKGRELTEGWPEKKIPEHIRWLEENREVKRGSRFLVEGVRTDWHDAARINSPNTGLIVRTIGDHLQTAQARMGMDKRNFQAAMAFLIKQGIHLQTHRGARSEPKMVLVPPAFYKGMIEAHKDNRSVKIPTPETCMVSYRAISVARDTSISDEAAATTKETTAVYRLPTYRKEGEAEVKRGVLVDVGLLVADLQGMGIHCNFKELLGDLWNQVDPKIAKQEEAMDETITVDSNGQKKWTLNKPTLTVIK
jgi:hypothetical protein